MSGNQPLDFGDSSSDEEEEGLVQETSTARNTTTTAASDDNKKKKRKKPEGDKKKKKSKKTKKPKKKKSKVNNEGSSMFDDAAVESGSDSENDNSDDDEEEGSEDNNDYEIDGFVVDEKDVDEPQPQKRKQTGGLEDSDDDDDDDDDIDKPKKKKKLQRVRDMDTLDEDDLDLINEAQGLPTKAAQAAAAEAQLAAREKVQRGASFVKGRNVQELSQGLFTGDTDDDEEDANNNNGDKKMAAKKSNNSQQQQQRPERYDEDGLDDFIEDDVEDGMGGYSDPRGGGGGNDDIMATGNICQGVTESMLQEHLDIFGTDYMDFMEGTKKEEEEENDDDEKKQRRQNRRLRKKDKFKEEGVGVGLAVDSDEEIDEDDDSLDVSLDSDDDDADLFGDDDMDQDEGDKQRAEVLKLKREKKRLARDERRKERNARIEAKRKAQLRRAFEPVQLVENFCTERDDAIRIVDSPERYYDWLEKAQQKVLPNFTDEITEEEDEESFWIMQKIPAIQSEWAAASNTLVTPGENMDTAENEAAIEQKERAVLTSIVYALRYMRIEKLEPEFIRRYRKDIVTSPAVRTNLYKIMDEDTEWERMTEARSKIESILMAESKGNGDDGEDLLTLKNKLKAAEEKLDRTLKDETRVKEELGEVEKAVTIATEAASVEKKTKVEDGEDDDDDDLFGDDDDDEEGNEAAKEAKLKEKEGLQSHLSTISTQLNVQSEEVARLSKLCQAKEAETPTSTLGVTSSEGEAIADAFSQRSKKMAKDKLWHYGDYSQYVLSMTEYRQVMDMKVYLNLVKEGNEAVRDKMLLGTATKASKKEKKKRSRRFDWDYYRTCVSEGLRSICYKFVLSPFRVGIKLEDTLTSPTGFSYDKTLPGDDGDDADMEMGDPKLWSAPIVEGLNPQDFGSQLIDSGELVSLATARDDAAWDANPELTDPLRACRYVAAMELAHEPRIRRALRTIYRSEAVISTRPTAKGIAAIDAFHEYYGLHLLKDKPVKEHFPMDQSELGRLRARLNATEIKQLDDELKEKETSSCIQYLNLIKAERSGDISLNVHLPYLDDNTSAEPWYKRNPDKLGRDKQNIRRLMEALERVYLPVDGDSDEWTDERGKILRMTLVHYLLPQFEAEVRRDLRDASTRVGIEAAGQNLQTIALEGPYRPKHLLGENRFISPTGDLPIVGVCSSNDAKDGTFLAAVNEMGELNDHVAVPGGTSVSSDNVREKIITFLMQTRPAAIVVGSGGGVSTRVTQRKLAELVGIARDRWSNRLIQGQDEDDDDYEARVHTFQMMHPNDEDEDFEWKCDCEIVDDNVAQLFGRSVRGKKEFPDTAVNLKVAIATARWAKEPLAELAYTWSAASDAGVFGTEMLFLNIHPLQRLLPKPMLLREYERVLCNVTAEVGVDVNASCTYDHLHGLLTFVPGLGPRKANNLKQNIARIGGVVSSRKAILAKRLLGPIVYNNCIAFLRIRDKDQLQDQNGLHPLDDTRCHPDVYTRNRWAIKIAVDALELGDAAAQTDEYAISALHDVMQNSKDSVLELFKQTKDEYETLRGLRYDINSFDPKVSIPIGLWTDKVEELDLEAFADMIEQSGAGKWLSQLTLVKWEFRVPYEDPRKPMELPYIKKRQFQLLTGESEATLCPGKEVTGKVIKNGDFGSNVKLEGDVSGFIPLRNLSDDHVESAEDILSVGDIVTALITNVKIDHLTCDLTIKKEDFRKKSSEWERPSVLPPLDDHFDKAAALKIDEEKDKEREARLESLRLTIGGTKMSGDAQEINADGSSAPVRRSGKVTRRACAHPAFRNATHDKVDAELKEAGDAMVGEALIRPSNKSCDSLAIHWMVRPGCIKVIEVLEEDKDTDASVGNRLIIKKEVYESIDELLGRYIAPMNDRVEEVLHHRKFLDKLEDEVDEKLQQMKQATPAGVFYFICWSESYPGYVSLRFIMSRTPRHHTIGISPEGFLWGNKTYSSMDRLMNDFKKNPAGQGAKPNRPTAGSSTNSSMRVAPSEESSRQSRWGSRGAPNVPPPSRWGGATSQPLPPLGQGPPVFAAPQGLPPAGLPPQFNRPPPPNVPPPSYR